MYPQITIDDTYKTIDDERYLLVNPEILKHFRENIVTNAIKAHATQLDIDHEMKESCIIITYSDNGDGMTAEEVDKVMLTQHGDGVLHGIGTKNILKIAEDHGVSLTYASEPGKGTTIRAVIPYAEKMW